MKEAVQHCAVRPLPPPAEPFMWLSGLEDLVVTKERFQFLNVGERYGCSINVLRRCEREADRTSGQTSIFAACRDCRVEKTTP